MKIEVHCGSCHKESEVEGAYLVLEPERGGVRAEIHPPKGGWTCPTGCGNLVVIIIDLPALSVVP